MGSGDAWDDIIALSRRLGLGRDRGVHGPLPDEFMQRWLSTAEVCLSPDPVNLLNEVSTMNKVVEYMAMGRPAGQRG